MFDKIKLQSRMQALHACFGVGAVIGPALVGAISYKRTFIILAVVSILPSLALLVYSVYIKISSQQMDKMIPSN